MTRLNEERQHKQQRKRKPEQQLSSGEHFHAMLGAVMAGLLIAGIFILAMFLFLLFCTGVWLR